MTWRLHTHTFVVLASLLVFATTVVTVPGAHADSSATHITATNGVPQPPNPADPAEPDDVGAVTLAMEQNISIQEAQRRLAWQEKAGGLGQELQRTLGDRFGGVWIDQDDGGRIKVGVSGALVDIQAQTDRRGLTEVTDLVPVQYGFDFLYAASEWLGGAVVEANEGAADGLESALVTDHNAVQLRLPRGKPLTAAQQALVDEARYRYGTALLIDFYDEPAHPHAPCRRDSAGGLYCDPPLRAGVAAHTLGNPPCTVGFIARSRVDSKMYVFTAGHCVVVKGQTWYTYFYNGSRHIIGSVHDFRRDSGGDYAIIWIYNVPGWTPKPWVYVNGTEDTAYDPDYYIAGDSGSSVGMRVCITGAFGLTDCGRVQAVNVTAPWKPHVRHLARAIYCAVRGDSGGPVYSSHNARGIHIGGVAGCGDQYYQGSRAAEDAMNVNIVHGTR